MNACLLQLPFASTGNMFPLLQDILRESPYWGETDVTQLRVMAERAGTSKGVPIMVARYQGVRGLWICDPSCGAWLSIGRLDYWTRAREDVTLLQSLTLRHDPSLQHIDASQVRDIPRNLSANIRHGFRFISRSYEDVKAARCQVSLDKESEMYDLEFTDPKQSGTVFGRLDVKRTSDAIELLRRPSVECEPVEVGGRRLVLNRFHDIQYDVHTTILRPWVERRDPFPTTELALPPTAADLAAARRWPGLELRIIHEDAVCTKSPRGRAKTFRDEDERAAYLKDIEGPPGQPDSLYFESARAHGACWRVILECEGLPEGVTCLSSLMMKGYALATLLKTGALVYKSEGDWIIHEFEAPDVKVLPEEFRESYALVQTYRDLVPRVLEEQEKTGIRPPARAETWKVSVSWSTDHVVWSARSDTTSRTYLGRTFTVQLHRGASLEHNVGLVMESVTHGIPEERVKDFEELEEQVKDLLAAKGFKIDLVCEAQVTGAGDTLKIHLKKRGISRDDALIIIRLGNGMTVEEAWDQLLLEMKRSNLAGHTVKQEHRVKKQMKREMDAIAERHGWGEVLEGVEGAPRYLDIFKYSTKRRALQKVIDTDIHRGLRQLEVLRRELEEAVAATGHGGTYLLELLLDKNGLLENKELKGSVNPVMKLQDLDRIYELSLEIEGVKLKRARGPFWTKLRRALDERQRLRKALSRIVYSPSSKPSGMT